LHRFLWNLLSEHEELRMMELVHEINARTFRVSIKNVRLAYASTQWGSCGPHGNIMLNTSLLFLPSDLLLYVIVHELAHRIIRSHSRAYWREVASVFPQWEEARKRLHAYRITSL
jgi:hypothetical protein